MRYNSMTMDYARADGLPEQEGAEYFNEIERDYAPYGLRQGPNEFYIIKGKKKIHIAKRYEVLIGFEGARRWVAIRDFIDQILADEGVGRY